MPSLPHRPALAPRDGISSFVSVQSSESYYSDGEIAILHDVVSAAQENLNLLPEGERLATNALFQAYDAVLPLHGIDPEEDHHISRLVFRVGGERGDGSLLDKLRAVLSRMGIGLEFDSRSDGSRALSDHGDGAGHREASPPSPVLTATDQSSDTTEDDLSEEFRPTQPDEFKSLPQSFEADQFDDPAYPPRLMRANWGPNHFNAKAPGRLNPPSQSYIPSTAGNTEQSRQSHQSGVGSIEQPGASDTTVQPVEVASAHFVKNENEPAPPVRSKPIRTVNWLLPTDAATEPAQNGGDLTNTKHASEAHEPDKHEPDARDPSVHEPDEHTQPAESLPQSDAEHRKESPFINGQLKEDPEEEARYALLERRARNAARYLVLLKGTSHWKQYAREKLERTALARRHILRMRHFDPWELVTAETKFRGRRIFTSRLLTLWLRRTDDDILMEHRASAHAQQKLGQDILALWSASCPAYAEPHHSPRFMAIYLQQWQSACFVSQGLQARVEDTHKKQEALQVFKFWRHQSSSCEKDAASFRRFNVIHDSLGQWHMGTSVEIFRAKMGVKLIRSSLSRWQSACRAPPSRGSVNLHGQRRGIEYQTGRVLPRLSRGGSSLMAISDRMLKTKVLGNWQRQASAIAKTSTRSRRFAVHQGAQMALGSWHLDMDRGRSISAWALRGCFYVGVTHALKTWRSKAVWRSNTRKAYARCRQHVKATLTKGYLGRWRATTRAHTNINWEANQHHVVMERDRLVHMLGTWRDESSNDRGAGKLLTAAWVDEWHAMARDHEVTQDRTKEAWRVTLKSRYWSQWQSALLQLKSREYVALDVRERNSKKLVRRLLLHWKGDGDWSASQQSMAMRASLSASRRGAGLGPSRNSAPLARAVHERGGGLSLRGSRMQEVGPTVEEEDHDAPGSGVDTDGVVADTPTRWTGMASSVRLPSMTPFAPLPTPFERELRERYNRSMPTAPTSQLSRLSFAQAQRLSVADTRRMDSESKTRGSGRRD